MIEDGKVVGYNGTATDVYIPIKYSVGESTAYVTGISAAAFKNSSVVSVSIPATVTEIGDSAFYGCSSLATVLSRTEITFARTAIPFSAVVLL